MTISRPELRDIDPLVPDFDLVWIDPQPFHDPFQVVVDSDHNVRGLEYRDNPSPPARLFGHEQNVRTTDDHTRSRPDHAANSNPSLTVRMCPVADNEIRSTPADHRADRPRDGH